MKFSIFISFLRPPLLQIVIGIVISFLVLAACNPLTALSGQRSVTSTPKLVTQSSTPLASTPTVTATSKPSETPTSTRQPEVRLASGEALTEYQETLFNDLEAAFEKNWEYWAGAKPPLVDINSWNQRIPYVFVDGKNPYSLGAAWGFPGESLVYSFAWSHKGPVTTPPTDYDQSGEVLPLSNPLRLSRAGTEENGTVYQLGWYGEKWVRIDVTTKTIEKVINDQGVFEGGDGILKNLEERCSTPVIYKGSYQGVEIPVQLSTDKSYINYSVILRDPSYSGRLSEVAAKLMYYWWELKNRGKSIDDFMVAWKNGTAENVVVEANFPSNSEYKALPANVNLKGFSMHFVLVDANNWRWKGKLFNKPNKQGDVGIYTSGSELVVLMGICNNHISFSRPLDTDPYGPEVDFLAALSKVTGDIAPFQAIRGSLQIDKVCK
jgi:hypothetical protein